MNKQIALFLRNNYSTDPVDVDRILVSAFVTKNKLAVKNNLFLKAYIIHEDSKRECEMLLKFLEVLKKKKVKLSIEDLIELFEFVISPEDKVITGAVYTPLAIREHIIKETLLADKADSIKVADISCGCGGFLYNAAKAIRKHTDRTYSHIFSRQLFGLDIQPYSVTRTKLLLSLLAVNDGEDRSVFNFNLFSGNALNFGWKKKVDGFEGFDLVVGNPPYVCARNISEESRAFLSKWGVCASGHPDLYIPFFQIALENLTEDGVMGYITMNTFFKSVNGRALRKYFQESRYRFQVIDFNTLQLFKSRSTYTCICIIEKRPAEAIQYFKCTDLAQLSKRKTFISIGYAGLDAWKGWNLNPNQELIAQIERNGTPFQEKYKTRNGFATLKNNVYLFTPSHENRAYYFLQQGQAYYPIEKAVCKEAVNPNLLTKVEDLASIKEKLIFPYEFVDGKPTVIPEERFKEHYPKAYEYLSTHKKVLATRDKGKGKKYKPWYMFGRSQSLERLKHKLFFPHITPQTPNYLIDSDENLLFYNGIAVIGDSIEELLILKKLLSSRLFWFYIKNTSKPYGSAYFSLSKNYIKDFGIFNFSKEDKEYIRQETDKLKLDNFFEEKYKISFDEPHSR
jgi:adenine-specific DNA-methyltransferase